MSMIDIIKASVFTPLPRGWGLPIIFWGKPGVGKSDILETIGRTYSLPTEVLSPGERGEGAFGVTPVPVKIGKDEYVITYPKPDWVYQFEDAEGAETEGAGGLVFVDEINTVPSLMPPMLGLIQARRLGSTYLGRRVRILGAANPPEISAGGHDLPAPVANRVGHIDWQNPSADEWGEWLMEHDGLTTFDIKPQSAFDEEKRVLKLWSKQYAMARGLIRGFIRAHRSLLHVMPEPGDPQVHRSWPSHRTWAMSTAAIAGAKIHNLSEEDEGTLVSSFIGEGAYLELAAYANAFDLPDPEKLLDGKIKWKPDVHRVDRTMAVLSTATAYIRAIHDTDKKTPKFKARVIKMYELLILVGEDAPDVVVSAIKPLSALRLTKITPKAITALAKLRPILDAAGITG